MEFGHVLVKHSSIQSLGHQCILKQEDLGSILTGGQCVWEECKTDRYYHAPARRSSLLLLHPVSMILCLVNYYVIPSNLMFLYFLLRLSW